MPTIKFLLILLTTSLVACGGGSGGGDNNDVGNTTSSSTAPKNYSLNTDKATVSFTATRNPHDNSPIPSQTIAITYKGDGVIVGYPPGVNPPSWLSVDLKDLGDGKMSLSLAAAISWYTTPQKEHTTVRLVTGKADGSEIVYADIVVNLTVLDNLGITSTDTFEIGMTPDGTQQSGNINFQVETWSKSWEITSDVDWLRFSALQGTGMPLQELQTVTISVDPTKTPKTDTTAYFTLKEKGNGLSVTQAINLKIDEPRFWFDRSNLAMSLFDGESDTQKTLKIFGNVNVDLNNLSFTSDVDWLAISKLDGEIKLTANRSSLLPGIHYAKVSILKDGKSVITAPLTLGFYIHNGKYPSDVTYIMPPAQYVIQDPIRPFVYRIASSKVQTYNIYTGELVREIDIPDFANKRQYIYFNSYTPHYVSEDGAVFYLYDEIGELTSTDGEKYVYHRLDITNNSWLSDVPARGNTPPHFVNGVHLSRVDYKYKNIVSGTDLRSDNSCKRMDLDKDNYDYINASIINNFIYNGTELYFLQYQPIDNISSIANVQLNVFKKVDAITCTRRSLTTFNDLVSSNEYSMSKNGKYLVVKDRLYTFDSLQGYVNDVELTIPQVLKELAGQEQIYRDRGSLVTDNGHVFVGRDVFTGRAYEPEYVTEYDATGKELRTIKQAPDIGGKIILLMFSSDGRRLLVQHDAQNTVGIATNLRSTAIDE